MSKAVLPTAERFAALLATIHSQAKHLRRRAAAKINLHLAVFGREENGLHEIESLMTRATLADHIHCAFLDHEGILQFHCNAPDLDDSLSNLAARAARAWIAERGEKRAFCLCLEKNIPHGAGLGGGSADAAAVLLALQELAGPTALPADRLLRLAASLGSDLSYCLHPGAAIVRSTGESLMAVPELPSWPCLIIKPAFSVSSAQAYAWLDSDRHNGLDRLLPRLDNADIVEAVTASPENWASLFRNDFSAPLLRRYPSLAEILAAMERCGSAYCSISGSGPSIFAVFHSVAERDDAGKRFLADAARRFSAADQGQPFSVFPTEI